MSSTTELQILFSEAAPYDGDDYGDDVYELFENYYINNTDKLEVCIRAIKSCCVLGCLNDLELAKKMLKNSSSFNTN